MPQFVKNQNEGWQSIIGGAVYRGTCFPDLVGYHFFTDYSAAELWRGKFENGTYSAVELTPPDLAPLVSVLTPHLGPGGTLVPPHGGVVPRGWPRDGRERQA